MRFALIDNERVLPVHGLKARCPSCGAEMIAKCGTARVHHWAHRGKRVCDHWWETETEWHRNWKEKFPQHWQEIIHFAENGEKHIADVKTERGLTIEFQYSHLRPDERISREQFYGNIVWVVNGTRLKRDLPRFMEYKDLMRETGAEGIYTCHAPERLFPRNWINSSACVFFDFGEQEGRLHILWCLLPYRVSGHAVIIAMQRSHFVDKAQQNLEIIPARLIAENIAQMMQLAAAHQARIDRQRAAMYMLKRRQWRGKRRPRF